MGSLIVWACQSLFVLSHPTGGTVAGAVVLNVNPQRTVITLDDGAATLEDLAELGEGNSVTASYYPNNLMATEIHAESP